MINTLKALDEDGNLPEEIILSGHSRGAVAAHELGNNIYAEFSDRIKLHYIMTDPVPGPFHNSDIYERVIPPNTVSYTVFYAPKEDRLLFDANDLNKLVFTNPLTTITAYAVPETEHISITGAEGRPVYYAAYYMVSAIHGQEGYFEANEEFTNRINAVRHNLGEIKGEGARSKSKFDYRTPVYCENSTLADGIHKTREMFENGYQRSNDSTPFSCPGIDNKIDRENLLKGTWAAETKKIKEANQEMFKKNSFFGGLSTPPALSTPDFSDKLAPMFPAVAPTINTDAYQEVKKIRDTILNTAPKNKEGEHKVKFKLLIGERYVTKTEKEVLKLIDKTDEKTKKNPASPLWQAALAEIKLKMGDKSEQLSLALHVSS